MSKLPFKVVAVDMDGTFMRNDQTFDRKRFNRILNQLRADGGHFIVSSGRPYQRLRKDFIGFLDRIDMVADNGSLLLQDDQIISTHLLTNRAALDLIRFIQEYYPESSIIVTGIENSYTTISASPAFKQTMNFYYPDRVEVPDLMTAVSPHDQITKLTLSYRHDFSAELEKEFNAHHAEKIHCTSSGFGLMDIVPYSVNKGNALKYFLRYFDAKPSELIAFGDGMNDKEMLELAGYSYAMENAEPALKKVAKYIAPSNNDDGVLQVLDEYLNN
ncbi:Cof-type HAD-IIB family hydrolase [Lactobacillus helveticus]|uniref:Cof-type HAD-IIB family hydrolase n=2 Tax=Lactobacillaceae TaxID=33958 RepID=UPI001561AE75|nr:MULTISPECIES: Cof-type HAD-IIB family hydrolase [Lactobacillus]MBN6048824.1 HAD family hydrolase [Lactobacillus helveticus]MCO0807932.1 Cof-type HAD-IIB family hydrolase [Lactobacillus helveticus]MCP9317672.1 HAD family hydrolase [Lactobacillus helveticus]MCT0165099.1 HAD family hydrolase [Lactobacillus helveticus]MCT0193208.1 HAD family hydrolase [Lactobacillus helveticus]